MSTADLRRDSKRDDPPMELFDDDLGPLPTELQRELAKLEDMFAVDTEKLKEICDRFEEELNLGLARMSRCLLPSLEEDDENGSIPMNVTWIQSWPTGQESGEYLTLDLGGTNLRVCWVTLRGFEGETSIDQETYQIPEEYKEGQAEPLYTFLIDSIEEFLHTRKLLHPEHYQTGNEIPLGFTFSFPVSQEKIDHGVLQTWTKGFDVKGVEGHDVAGQLREALLKRDLPISLVALVNDTTGAMIASKYRDPQTVMGAIFGTGCNAAYFETCAYIPKISGLPLDQPMAINCEYGAFDNEHLVLPRTAYDVLLDEDSPRPGEQAFEKLSAGLYLGEIYRLVILDLANRELLFHGQSLPSLRKPYCLDTVFLSAVENDKSPRMQKSQKLFQDVLDIEPHLAELFMLRRLAEAIAIRGARLCCCGIAAICRKTGVESGHVAADGSVANKHPRFKKRWAKAMGEVLDWPADRSEDPIVITAAEDGSSIGAAVISAMAPQWPHNRDRRGSRSNKAVQASGGAQIG